MAVVKLPVTVSMESGQIRCLTLDKNVVYVLLYDAPLDAIHIDCVDTSNCLISAGKSLGCASNNIGECLLDLTAAPNNKIFIKASKSGLFGVFGYVRQRELGKNNGRI